MFEKFGMFFVVLAGVAVSGCSQTIGAVNTGYAVTQNLGHKQKSFVTVSKAGGTTIESGCVQVVPGSKNCLGVIVASRGGLFTPSAIAMIPVDCLIEPKCKSSLPIGGVAEPTGNVLIGALGNVFSGAFTPVSNISNVAYGGEGGSAYAEANANAQANGGNVVINGGHKHHDGNHKPPHGDCKKNCGGGGGTW